WARGRPRRIQLRPWRLKTSADLHFDVLFDGVASGAYRSKAVAPPSDASGREQSVVRSRMQHPSKSNNVVTFEVRYPALRDAIVTAEKTIIKTYENDLCLHENCSALVGSGNSDGHVWARGHLFVDKLPIRYPRRRATRRSKPCQSMGYVGLAY